MSVNQANNLATNPIYIKRLEGSGGKQESYANLDDIANIRKVSENHWEADAVYSKNACGGVAVHHFDNESAKQIINHMTGNILPKQ